MDGGKQKIGKVVAQEIGKVVAQAEEKNVLLRAPKLFVTQGNGPPMLVERRTSHAVVVAVFRRIYFSKFLIDLVTIRNRYN